jgi:hypothetical protein
MLSLRPEAPSLKDQVQKSTNYMPTIGAFSQLIETVDLHALVATFFRDSLKTSLCCEGFQPDGLAAIRRGGSSRCVDFR